MEGKEEGGVVVRQGQNRGCGKRWVLLVRPLLCECNVTAEPTQWTI